ncbi:hypothetical protein ACQB6R_12365 [Propionibacteriaceae bacterium G1746]|uniref:hypothetical protein n=1 Tax=Aestuariimicrobium sp. G57 TaxID=3418485 RepID=UPI003C29F830
MDDQSWREVSGLAWGDVSRHWVEFVDPADADQLIRADLTWLTSDWSCIFGQGCRGISADHPGAGCCTFGAHFTEPADEARVAAHVERLTDELWQHRAEGLALGWAVDAEDDVHADEPGHDDDNPDDNTPATPRQTRRLDVACIFHNDATFAAGSGCALHLLALRQGMSPVETKPDVCWQLPIRRQYRHGERADGSPTLEITITEFTRGGWGAGGADLAWYCTGSPAAHVGSEPVFRTSRDELVELIGQSAYDVLSVECETFLRRRMPLHPATVAARGSSTT